MTHDVHLVGSVPLANAEQVFSTVSAALGRKVKRIPDGETGARSDWITWLEPLFSDNPALEKSDEVFRVHAQAKGRRRYRLKPGCAVQDVRFDIHYTDGVEGTKQRLATARRHVKRFPVATECGFGRRDPATIPELLRIHAEVAAMD